MVGPVSEGTGLSRGAASLGGPSKENTLGEASVGLYSFIFVGFFVFCLFRRFLAGIRHRDPENRVRDAILRVLVVGELLRMISKLFYDVFLKKRRSG